MLSQCDLLKLRQSDIYWYLVRDYGHITAMGLVVSGPGPCIAVGGLVVVFGWVQDQPQADQ